MDAILLGIDGTGVIDKADYKREMRTSFVRYTHGAVGGVPNLPPEGAKSTT